MIIKKVNKQDITQCIIKNHQDFVNTISNLSDDDFLFSDSGKWSAAQQLEHIYKSVKPVAMALGLPKILPRLLFGKANRSSKTHEALVEKYLSVLTNGGKASKAFIPKVVALNQKQQLLLNVTKLVATLCERINAYSEKELDTYVLPHPLLGKLTIREMLFFTLYHVEHHHTMVKKNLKKP